MANNLFLMINGNGTYQVGVESNGTFYGASASIPPQDLNAWVHLAGTYDGTTWRLYRDGQLVASSTASIGAISMSQAGIYKPTWGIGAATSFPVGGMRYFDGAIDDVRIYNTAISSSAISSLEAIPPTVAAPAAASPATVTGTTAALSVLGADAAGESTLTYAWAAAGTPPAPVTFSANGSHAAQNTTVTFTAAGTYNFLVTIANAAGLTAAGSVSVTVSQTLTSIIVAGQPLAAMAYDQFGNPLANQPAYDSGSDTISAALALASNVTVVPAAGSQLTLSGGISGAGTLTVDTQGTVVLTGTNSYTGGTTVSAGKLILTSSSTIAANSSLMVGANLSLFAPSFAASPSAVPAVATSAPNTVAAGTPSGLNDSPFAVPSCQRMRAPKGRRRPMPTMRTWCPIGARQRRAQPWGTRPIRRAPPRQQPNHSPCPRTARPSGRHEPRHLPVRLPGILPGCRRLPTVRIVRTRIANGTWRSWPWRPYLPNSAADSMHRRVGQANRRTGGPAVAVYRYFCVGPELKVDRFATAHHDWRDLVTLRTPPSVPESREVI